MSGRSSYLKVQEGRHGLVTLRSEIRVPHEREVVFDFFSDAFNLELLTPEFLRFRVLTPPPIEMSEGLLIDYRLLLHGIRMQWQSCITRWDPPSAFVDEQVRGPYRMWRHLHTFEADGDGTLVRDKVEYRVPGGKLVNRLLVQRDVERIFAHRHIHLDRVIAESFARRRADIRLAAAS